MPCSCTCHSILAPNTCMECCDGGYKLLTIDPSKQYVVIVERGVSSLYVRTLSQGLKDVLPPGTPMIYGGAEIEERES